MISNRSNGTAALGILSEKDTQSKTFWERHTERNILRKTHRAKHVRLRETGARLADEGNNFLYFQSMLRVNLQGRRFTEGDPDIEKVNVANSCTADNQRYYLVQLQPETESRTRLVTHRGCKAVLQSAISTRSCKNCKIEQIGNYARVSFLLPAIKHSNTYLI